MTAKPQSIDNSAIWTGESLNGKETEMRHTKRAANGHCQLCVEPAPFRNKEGEPYLETHHIVWLARDGDDTISNTVALCPNCHKKMHVCDDEKDVDALLQIKNA